MKRPLSGVVVLLALAAAACDPSSLDNTAPEASAGEDVEAFVGESVTLDASGSTDADADELTYAWTITTQPDTSAATLSNATTAAPSFTADVPGTYVFQVTVSDDDDSDTDEVTLTASWDLRLSGTISTDSTLPDRGAPYIVEGALSVTGGTLTIAPGVTIQVAQDARISIGAGAVIRAVGTAQDTIRFLGSAATAGHWDGLEIGSASPLNELAYVEIAHGGSGGYADVYVNSVAVIKITNSLLRSSSTFGVHVEEGGQLTGWATNTLRDNAGAGILLSPNTIRYLDAASVYAGGATTYALNVFGGTASTAGTWPKTDGPYLVQGQPQIAAAVTVQPGVEMQFSQDNRFIVASGGSLNAAGTAEDTIRFTGTQAQAGFWDGVEIISTSTSNVLDYVEIAHGGSGGYANVYVNSTGSVKITNARLRNSSTFGVAAEEGGQLTGWATNTLADNVVAGVELSPNTIRYLDAATTYAGGATPFALQVYGGTVETAGTWPATDKPYRVDGQPAIAAAVTVQAGATLLFTQDNRLIVASGGSLTAAGTATDTVTFAGTESVPGFWDGIEFISLSASNSLTYTTVGFGGSGGYANLYVNSTGGVVVDHVLIHDSSTCGVEVEAGGTYTATNASYSSNGTGDVCP